MIPPLLIIGASARAAAFSALRAGLTPRCADLFADLDLACRCEVQRLEGADYPHGFRDVVLAHAGPWLYTGALENHRLLISEMARARPLWGNDEEALNPCRLPDLWTQVLHDAGVPCPRVRFQVEDAAQSPVNRWLVKPLRGAGGVGIRFWDYHPLPPFTFLQEYIDGLPCSAIYLGEQRQARLLGVTGQLVGQSWLHAGAFRYCGSVGPLRLSDEVLERFDQLGQAIAAGCDVRGLFGVDAVLAEGVPWPVEINPRYTASVEVLEHAAGLRALDLHRQVFEGGTPIRAVETPWSGTGELVGKAILFAARDLVFPEDGPWLDALGLDPWRLPPFADIPAAGTPIRRGQPILTLLVRGGNTQECLAKLHEAAARLWFLTS